MIYKASLARATPTFLVLSIVIACCSSGYSESVPRSGDVREGYESADYQTRSSSLEERVGKAIDLYKLSRTPQLGLPPVQSPSDNPLTAKGIALGRRLFFDRRLSINDTMSCAICHVPEMGFTSNELKTSVGVEGRSMRRNAPTIFNVAYKTLLFHDGREFTLENQVWSPLLAHREMANPSIGYVIKKIQRTADYQGVFEEVFGRAAAMDTIGMALAQYQRTLLSGGSRFDRWYYGGEKSLLSADEQLGFEIFTTKGACSACHLINKKFALFTDHQLHNTGLGYRSSMEREAPTQRVQLAPGVFIDLDNEKIRQVSRDEEFLKNDLGHYEVTEDPVDLWKYLTPTLRNVELTAPYMHNGEFLTLAQVIEFYNQGGIPNKRLSPLIKPLALSDKEKQALEAFLKTLTGSNVAELVADAFAAPVGDATK